MFAVSCLVMLVRAGELGLLIVGGPEHREYRFANGGELDDDGRYGVNVDTGLMQDFGPTVLLPMQDDGGIGEG